MSENAEPTSDMTPEEGVAGATPAATLADVPFPAPSVTPAEEKKRKKTLWIGIATIVAIALIGLGVFFGKSGGLTPEPTTAKPIEKGKFIIVPDNLDGGKSNAEKKIGDPVQDASTPTAAPDPAAPGDGSDDDPTVYPTTDTVLFPADITDVAAGTQSAAMASWVTMAAVPNQTSSVSNYFTALKNCLDAEAAVVFDAGAYDPAAPVALVAGSAAVNYNLLGADSAAASVAEYNKVLTEFNLLLDAIKAAGYTDVTWNASNVATFGSVVVAEQDWAAFVAAYDAMTAAGM